MFVRRNIATWLIPLFCIFHMTAVLAYLLPRNINSAIDSIKDGTRGYVLITSQWQKWDIFSPNPTRQVHDFRIVRTNNENDVLMHLDKSSVPWWQQAKERKVLGRLRDGWEELAPSYLLSLCPRIPEAASQDIALVDRMTIIPRELTRLKNIDHATLQAEEKILTSVRCPPLQ